MLPIGQKSSDEVENLIVTLNSENHKTSEIIRLLNIRESTFRTVWNKYIYGGMWKNLQRIGRP